MLFARNQPPDGRWRKSGNPGVVAGKSGVHAAGDVKRTVRRAATSASPHAHVGAQGRDGVVHVGDRRLLLRCLDARHLQITKSLAVDERERGAQARRALQARAQERRGGEASGGGARHEAFDELFDALAFGRRHDDREAVLLQEREADRALGSADQHLASGDVHRGRLQALFREALAELVGEGGAVAHREGGHGGAPPREQREGRRVGVDDAPAPARSCVEGIDEAEPEERQHLAHATFDAEEPREAFDLSADVPIVVRREREDTRAQRALREELPHTQIEDTGLDGRRRREPSVQRDRRLRSEGEHAASVRRRALTLTRQAQRTHCAEEPNKT